MRGATAVVATLFLGLIACDGGEAGSRTPPAVAASDGIASAPPAPSRAEEHSDWLLPNMRSIGASDLQVDRAGPGRRLRFAASLANVGAGPMFVVPLGRRNCPPDQIRVRQEVHVDGNGDGTFQRKRDRERVRHAAGCMLDHPRHDHWHLDAMASYRLHLPDGTPLASRNKVSFCLRDNRRARRTPRTVVRSYFGECSRTTPQGISPGWVDIYGADLDGQAVRLRPGVAGRTLCLTLTADPFDLLLESDETDNATTIALRVDGDQVRRLRSGC